MAPLPTSRRSGAQCPAVVHTPHRRRHPDGADVLGPAGPGGLEQRRDARDRPQRTGHRHLHRPQGVHLSHPHGAGADGARHAARRSPRDDHGFPRRYVCALDPAGVPATAPAHGLLHLHRPACFPAAGWRDGRWRDHGDRTLPSQSHRRRTAGDALRRRRGLRRREAGDQRGRRLPQEPGQVPRCRSRGSTGSPHGRRPWDGQDAARPRGRWRGGCALPGCHRLQLRGDVRGHRGLKGPGSVR